MRSPSTAVSRFNCPVEIAEARYGFDYRRLKLNDEPGGEGHGGRGVVKEFAIRWPETEMSIGYSRTRKGSGASQAARRARQAALKSIADGAQETHALVSGLKLAKGDVVRIVTAQGDGWGETQPLSY